MKTSSLFFFTLAGSFFVMNLLTPGYLTFVGQHFMKREIEKRINWEGIPLKSIGFSFNLPSQLNLLQVDDSQTCFSRIQYQQIVWGLYGNDANDECEVTDAEKL